MAFSTKHHFAVLYKISIIDKENNKQKLGDFSETSYMDQEELFTEMVESPKLCRNETLNFIRKFICSLSSDLGYVCKTTEKRLSIDEKNSKFDFEKQYFRTMVNYGEFGKVLPIADIDTGEKPHIVTKRQCAEYPFYIRGFIPYANYDGVLLFQYYGNEGIKTLFENAMNRVFGKIYGNTFSIVLHKISYPLEKHYKHMDFEKILVERAKIKPLLDDNGKLNPLYEAAMQFFCDNKIGDIFSSKNKGNVKKKIIELTHLDLLYDDISSLSIKVKAKLANNRSITIQVDNPDSSNFRIPIDDDIAINPENGFPTIESLDIIAESLIDIHSTGIIHPDRINNNSSIKELSDA